MTPLLKTCYLAFVVLLANPTVVIADYLEVRRNAYIYSEADRRSPPLQYIDLEEATEPVRLSLAAGGLKNGYYKVHLPNGTRSGWVYKSLVRRFPGAPAQKAIDVTNSPR